MWAVRNLVLLGALSVLGVGTPLPSRAGQDVDDALRRYQAGEYPAAIAAFRVAAGDGDALAQYYLGIMHLMGEGAARDATIALQWLTRSAEQGGADAALALGNLYASGAGVKQDAALAMRWLQRAAELAEAEGREPECE